VQVVGVIRLVVPRAEDLEVDGRHLLAVDEPLVRRLLTSAGHDAARLEIDLHGLLDRAPVANTTTNSIQPD